MQLDPPGPTRIGRDGRYVLQRSLGHGGMGEVYLALDTVLRRPVAIKIVAAHFRHSRRLRRRLLREAQTLALLHHPNVLEVYDVDMAPTGELFLAMAYVPGHTLATWQAEKGRSQSQILAAYVSAGEGLAAAHDQGVVHRDFKPANVLICDEPRRIVVCDFGLARSAVDEAHDHDASEAIDALLDRDEQDWRTTDGEVGLGTPAYMAPELSRGRPASFASDQYSFCVALWEACCGALPSVGQHECVPEQPAELPRWLYRVLCRGLASEPEQRFADMRALLRRLARGRARSRTIALALGLGALLALPLGASLLVRPDDPCEELSTRMAARWNDEVRARVASALAEPYAAHHAIEVLDRGAERWLTHAQATCRTLQAEPSKGSALARQACLERWFARFGDRIDSIETSAPSVVPHLLDWLGPIEQSDDFCAIPPPILHPDILADIERIDELRALREHDEALALLETSALRADQVAPSCIEGAKYSVERGELSLRRAAIHGDLESFGPARAAIDEALMHAAGCDHPELQVRASTLAARLFAHDLEMPEYAEVLLSPLGAALDRLDAGPDDPHRRELTEVRAFAALAQGDHDRAITHFAAAIEHLDEAAIAQRAKLYVNLGAAFHEKGDPQAAADAYEHAAELVVTALGPEHPEAQARMARVQFNLGLLAYERGDLAGAHERLAEITDGDASIVVKARTVFIMVLAEEGASEARITAESRVLATWLEHDLPPRIRAEALATIGHHIALTGDEQGLGMLVEAQAIYAHLGDEENLDLTQIAYAQTLAMLGRVGEAHEQLAMVRNRMHPNDANQAAVAVIESMLETAPATR